MSGYSRQEVARRAGVNPDYVDRLVDLGILSPGTDDGFSPGDARRARLVQSLERAGVPLDGMASAVRSGALSLGFMDLSSYDRFAGLSGTTFQEVSAKTGIPLDPDLHPALWLLWIASVGLIVVVVVTAFD